MNSDSEDSKLVSIKGTFTNKVEGHLVRVAEENESDKTFKLRSTKQKKRYAILDRRQARRRRRREERRKREGREWERGERGEISVV